MTGFGASEGPVGDRRARVEIRTVNHRWFNLTVRLTGDLAAVETDLREAVRKEFDRGHVSVHVSWAGEEGHDHPVIDLERAGVVVASLRELRDRFALAGDVSVDLVIRQPEVYGARRPPAQGGWSDLAPVVAVAVAECRAARQREGDVLTAELVGRLDALEVSAGRIERAAPERAIRERDRLRVAVRHLLDGVAADEQRLAQEIALLAERLDVTEEVVRFRAHVAAARAALARRQPVGKQLGFLAQEMGREVNTMGSKANDAAIAHDVVAMKGELEKIREQLENLE